MKKSIYILAITLGVIISGCSENFLEKDPPLSMSEKETFTTSERIEKALRGVYSQFKNTSSYSFMGGKSFAAIENKGDDLANISSNNVMLVETYNFVVTATSSENGTTWQEAYLTINNANVFLMRLEEAKEIAGSNYDKFKSEALFVRALTYYYLTTFYGKPYKTDANAKCVPLRLTPSLDGTGNNMPASTVGEIFEQILKDVSDENISKLATATNSEVATTRATQAAARALRMRVFMAMEKWDEAIAEGTAITGYTLLTDAAKLYETPYYNTEVIFTLPMASNNQPNTQQSLFEYHYDAQTLVVNTVDGIFSKEGYNNSKDQRVSDLIGPKESQQISLKFKQREDWVPIFRLAEIKLNLAECYAQKGGTSEDNAKTQLKEVRRRSLADADDSHLNNAAIDALTGDNLKTAIYNEKRLEFLGEGMRALDIHRRAENYTKPSKSINVSPTDNNYVWPIPQSETSINKEVK